MALGSTPIEIVAPFFRKHKLPQYEVATNIFQMRRLPQHKVVTDPSQMCTLPQHEVATSDIDRHIYPDPSSSISDPSQIGQTGTPHSLPCLAV